MVVGRRAENCAIECSVLGEGWFEWKGGVLCAALKAIDILDISIKRERGATLGGISMLPLEK